MLEHDDDDRYITQAVFDENHYAVKLHFVNSSDDLFAFLLSCDSRSLPALILLNHYAAPLNAVDILKSLKGNAAYRHIPTVVLSGTTNDEIISSTYAAGASSFITKPSSSRETSEKISAFVRYWFNTVELP